MKAFFLSFICLCKLVTFYNVKHILAFEAQTTQVEKSLSPYIAEKVTEVCYIKLTSLFTFRAPVQRELQRDKHGFFWYPHCKEHLLTKHALHPVMCL